MSTRDIFTQCQKQTDVHFLCIFKRASVDLLVKVKLKLDIDALFIRINFFFSGLNWVFFSQELVYRKQA